MQRPRKPDLGTSGRVGSRRLHDPAKKRQPPPLPIDSRTEWLETDGLGGFASGTTSGVRTRRYHALLLAASTPPTRRMALVNGMEAWLLTAEGRRDLVPQCYQPGVISPDCAHAIRSFAIDPWPTWRFDAGAGRLLRHELFVRQGAPVVALSWRLEQAASGVTLCVRPFFSGRDHHALHHENPAFSFAPQSVGSRLKWHPYAGVPGVIAQSSGNFAAAPVWYRNFLYMEERARGLDAVEDLAAPGVFRFDLSQGEAVLLLAAESDEAALALPRESAIANLASLRRAERGRRASVATPLARARDAYLVRRDEGRTILAGYPWFSDWGRDTFIAVRGLCLASGRLDEGRDILSEWSRFLSEGMLPNAFPERDQPLAFNSVDASLWYVVAVHDYWRARASRRQRVGPEERRRLGEAVLAIVESYARGTRFRIAADADGLLAAGEQGLQLTWMDAKVDGRPVTPRIGKPVEVQALWLNALAIAGDLSRSWRSMFERGLASFRERFWNESRSCLYDVVDVDHRSGVVDPALRPNQILAVGGLPRQLLGLERARRVVDVVEANLLTPLGLRSLAPGEPGYVPRYEGGVRERDGAYHQGTVWPWLIGPFVEAWVRVRGGAEAKREAAERFLAPLHRHLDQAGLNHVSEIADADAPFTPRGCPFQAWSVGELSRLDLEVLSE
jgi:predicted glycogen debranching enzyme